MALRNPGTAITNILVQLRTAKLAATPLAPNTLANLLNHERYTNALLKPTLVLGNAAQDRHDLVDAILVHLALVYGAYNLPTVAALNDKYDVLIYFFTKLQSSLNPAPVSTASLIALSMCTKYRPSYGLVFDRLNFTNDPTRSDVFSLTEYRAEGPRLRWNDDRDMGWLSAPWISKYCKKVYNNAQVRTLITDALRRGHFPTLPAAGQLTFPNIEIAIVSIEGFSGFCGPNKVHIAIDELVNTTLTKKQQDPKLTAETLMLWVKTQLAVTTIHEVSHYILRCNLLPPETANNVNISSPKLVPAGAPSTPESGFLSEMLFCERFFQAPPGRACFWDSMFYNTDGPFRDSTHPLHDQFGEWVRDLDAAFESGDFHQLPILQGNPAITLAHYMFDPYATPHEFII